MIPRRLVTILAVLFLLAGCRSAPAAEPVDGQQAALHATPFAGNAAPTGTVRAETSTPGSQAQPARTSIVPAASPTAPEPTPAPSPSPVPVSLEGLEPAGCQKPSNDLTLSEVNGWTLNVRTLAMLAHAQELYGGEVDLTNAAITQGSYHDNGAASFGTHLGGGAVDLSIFLPGTWTVDFPHLMRMVRSLRAAGFAAWVRDIDEVFPGSGYHIHAIAVGDPELSKEAEDQLTGTYGYFRGYNGLPKVDGVPAADREGGPILCNWMKELGYRDLRADPAQPPEPWPPADWQDRLEAAAESFQAGTQDETQALAQQLGYLGGNERPETLDGPLAAALWQAAGLLPPGLNPANRMRSYVPKPNRAQSLAAWFPEGEYEHQFIDLTGLERGGEVPGLRVGDLLDLQGELGRARMLVITGVGDQGEATTVTAVKGADGAWRVQPVLLGDLLWADGEHYSSAHLFRARFLRHPGTPIQYSVQPGDTLATLAARFGLDPAQIAARNALADPAHLQVGQMLMLGE